MVEMVRKTLLPSHMKKSYRTSGCFVTEWQTVSLTLFVASFMLMLLRDKYEAILIYTSPSQGRNRHIFLRGKVIFPDFFPGRKFPFW